MWRILAALLLTLLPVVPAWPQEEGHLTLRQVEEIFRRGRSHPPLTEEVGPEVDGMIVVYEKPGGPVYRLQPAVVTGAHVENAEPVHDDATDSWSVSIELGGPATARFASITSHLACRRDQGDEVRSRLATVVDGVVVSVAGMQRPAPDGSGGVACGTGIVDGRVQVEVDSQAEAEELATAIGWKGSEESSTSGPNGDGNEKPLVIPIVIVSSIVLVTAGAAIRRARTH